MRLIGWNGAALNTSIKTKYIRTWLVLNLLDIILTITLVLTGAGYEGNPLGAFGFNFLLLKMSGAIGVAIMFGYNQFIMRAVSFGIGLVVIWNLMLLVAIYA